jgi:hypothetical protein
LKFSSGFGQKRWAGYMVGEASVRGCIRATAEQVERIRGYLKSQA